MFEPLITTSPLICPLCRQSLIVTNRFAKCAQGHHFDRSKDGYLNLLPVHHKNSKEPGESKEQLLARRQFLNAGYFDALKHQLNEVISSSTASLLDIGCGEGYFTRSMCKHCATAQVYAVDISKSGIAFASKNRPENLLPIVASSFNLPFAPKSVDVITRILAPSDDSELAKVLRKDGLLIVVRPTANHLENLRRAIYRELRPYQQAQTPTGFKLEQEWDLSFSLDMQDETHVLNLFKMTPFVWRLNQAQFDDVVQNTWQDHAAFRISLYRKES